MPTYAVGRDKAITKFLYIRCRWPRKKIIEAIYFALTTVGLIIVLQYFILDHGVHLRSIKNTINEPFSSKLLDLKNFHWVTNNVSICKLENDTSKLLPIIVHSARNHFLKREVIRETYGSLSSYKNWTVRVIFFLGLGEDSINNPTLETESSKISDEIRKYGDIIVGNYIDTYRNLSYKHISGYRWILEHCLHATYVWKADDDMFLDPLTLVTWRDTEISRRNESGDMNKLIDIYCSISKHGEPQRDSSSKWYVPYSQWPASQYPTYCVGWAYGISIDWIKKIYDESLISQNVFWIDDIYVTGILVESAMKRTNTKPRMKKIARSHITHIDYPKHTIFCFQHNRIGVRRRMIGTFGWFTKGQYLVTEMKCAWKNIIEGIWRPLDFDE